MFMTFLAYPAVGQRKSALAAGLLVGAVLVLGCTAGVKPSGPGTGGSGGSGPGVGGTTGGGTTGTGGVGPGMAGSAGTIVINPDAGPCQQVQYSFDPKIPTVFILVDRSGSEFDPSTNGTTGIYFNLRMAVLQVLQQLKDNNTQMRLGMGLFVGDHATGSCQPVFDFTPIDDIATNYDAIAAKYNSLAALQPWGSKADTPMADTIPKIKTMLMSDTGTGPKYMLIATDGQTDFCDDGNNLCPADAIIYRAQDLFAATPSIGTLVLGLPTDVGGGMAFNMAVLQGVANAGVGQNPALTGLGVSTPTDVWNQCNGVAGWKTIATAAGRGMNASLATYPTPAGTAKVFTPTSTSTTDLAAQLSAAIAGVKSCTFDLNNVDGTGKSIQVDLTMLSKASVQIMGTTIQLDPNNTNGWDMVSATQLQLFGAACDSWRNPNTKDITFNFPCDIIGPG